MTKLVLLASLPLLLSSTTQAGVTVVGFETAAWATLPVTITLLDGTLVSGIRR